MVKVICQISRTQDNESGMDTVDRLKHENKFKKTGYDSNCKHISTVSCKISK